ncbi:unnamed protein product [Arabidopsis thaliana]|uniref:(thale cress) hypothetical protein n=1 Tax=Arabidopsis thaliana TaxID=3702 RepID=A0A7G2DW22_ARATH|nr:unnamed protein product [Arabidopsis thaliana]
MDGRSVPLELTKDDEYSYLGSMEEVYHDEPEKFNHILHLIRDYFNHRDDRARITACMGELMRDHLNLLVRFFDFFPAEASEGLAQLQTIAARSVSPDSTIDDAVSYINTVKEAFHDEPAKYYEFFQLFYDIRLVDVAGGITRVEELLKAHKNLLVRLNAFLPPEAQRILHLKIEQRAASDINKRKRVASFIGKLKERFQGDDRHVYESFLEILTMYQEGNKSVNDLYQEVVALLEGHEDLVMGFADVFKRPTDPSGSKSARDS